MKFTKIALLTTLPMLLSSCALVYKSEKQLGNSKITTYGLLEPLLPLYRTSEICVPELDSMKTKLDELNTEADRLEGKVKETN